MISSKSWMLQPSLFQPLHQIENRVESSDPSALSPPADAPDWALKPEYRKGEFKIN